PADQWVHERLPEGDPFAPQNTIPYLPNIIAEPPAPPLPPHPLKPLKKRRRLKREENCSFCSGNDARNKVGEPEAMVTCHECGRSGHPSCMELSRIGDMLRSYPWKCIECKNCELCGEKGDDERILFCDGCDRGWHFDCMQPPINELPEGEWYCPPCQDAAAQGYFSATPAPAPEMLIDEIPIIPLPEREASVASTSRSIPPMTPKSRGRSRRKAPLIVEEENEEDVEVEVEDPPPTPVSTRSKQRGQTRKRGRPSKQQEIGEQEPEEEEEEVDETPIPQPRSSRKRKRDREILDSSPAPIPRVRLRLATRNVNGKGKEREEQEEALGMFDGILNVGDRDTTKTMVTNHDKQLFERSRAEAERKLAPPPPPPSATSTTSSHAFTRSSISMSASDFDSPSAGPFRPTRSSTLQYFQQSQPVPTPSPVPSTPGGLYTLTTRNDPDTLRIKTIRFGQYDIKTWYDAPFPEEYASIPDGRMWICEFCLKYMKSRFQAMRHRLKCKVRHPPGDEIYRDGGISIFEVDGRKNKIYCQNLCLLSKMFLDHKSLFYDVEPFLFYVITEVDDTGARFVGYFSKEKRSPKEYNLSCIMTLPVRQRQGWGNLLIDFSYLLSKVEQRTGSPEKPLSSLGALGYRNYWTLAVMRYLEHAVDHPLLEIGAATSMTLEDVYETLAQQSMIFIREPTPPPIKPIPGQAIRIPKNRRHGSATLLRRSKSSNQLQRAQSRYKSQEVGDAKGPFVAPKHYEVRFDRERVRAYVRNWDCSSVGSEPDWHVGWTGASVFGLRSLACADVSDMAPHQSLTQALGQHIPYRTDYRNLSTSPPSHPQPPPNHSPLTFTVPAPSPGGVKRKHADNSAQGIKRNRRDIDDGDPYDLDPAGQGAKHWTDEEKTKLFTWLMGAGQDEHWNALRATKNSCLRECAMDVFGSKKTYQALKGCYERNFNLFKQIYAFEQFHAPNNSLSLTHLSEADRLREYERRLAAARKQGCDVGNITARTIEHWHRRGWYELFYRRWHGDPATTRPSQSRNNNNASANQAGPTDDPEADDDPPFDFPDPSHLTNGNGSGSSSGGGGSNDPPVVNITITQSMLSTYLQFLQVQTQTGKMKLEYLRRREEREEKESAQRREMERMKLEREAAEFEHNKHSANTKQKADRAIELLSNPSIDGSVKHAASEFLKKLFASD
ncbi:Histone acetyltransferase KAT7, partial [Leucoagaricus sp. SymC.cos]